MPTLASPQMKDKYNRHRLANYSSRDEPFFMAGWEDPKGHWIISIDECPFCHQQARFVQCQTAADLVDRDRWGPPLPLYAWTWISGHKNPVQNRACAFIRSLTAGARP